MGHGRLAKLSGKPATQPSGHRGSAEGADVTRKQIQRILFVHG